MKKVHRLHILITTISRFAAKPKHINLRIARKSNFKKPNVPWKSFLISNSRKRIETTFGQISNILPKRIHAFTVNGFMMKVMLFIFIFTINDKFLR
jgi:hypothetical protein